MVQIDDAEKVSSNLEGQISVNLKDEASPTNFSEIKSKSNTDASEKGEEVSQYISIAGKQYILYKGRVIISEHEASEIHQQYYK